MDFMPDCFAAKVRKLSSVNRIYGQRQINKTLANSHCGLALSFASQHADFFGNHAKGFLPGRFVDVLRGKLSTGFGVCLAQLPGLMLDYPSCTKLLKLLVAELKCLRRVLKPIDHMMGSQRV